MLPGIFQRTFSEVGDISAFEGILRYEQKLRWDEKKAMDKLRGRYDLCEKYYGRFRDDSKDWTPRDVAVMDNGIQTLHAVLTNLRAELEKKDIHLKSVRVDNNGVVLPEWTERYEYWTHRRAESDALINATIKFVEDLEKVKRLVIEDRKLTPNGLDKAKEALKRRRSSENGRKLKKKQRMREQRNKEKEAMRVDEHEGQQQALMMTGPEGQTLVPVILTNPQDVIQVLAQGEGGNPGAPISALADLAAQFPNGPTPQIALLFAAAEAGGHLMQIPANFTAAALSQMQNTANPGVPADAAPAADAAAGQEVTKTESPAAST